MKRLLLLILLMLVMLPTAAFAQPASPVAGEQEPSTRSAGALAPNKESVDPSMFYAYLREMPEASSGPVENLIANQLFPGKSIQDTPLGMQRFRPMLQWRHWANQRQRLLPSFGFCFAASCILWIPFGRKLDFAAVICRARFWRSLFVGVLVCMLVMFFARLLFLSGVGWPAGILVIALMQLGLVTGLVVSVNLVGEAVARVIRLTHIAFVAERPVVQRGLFLFIGAFILSGVLLIPGPGMLPPIGPRLIMLFALLGLGALYRSRFESAQS